MHQRSRLITSPSKHAQALAVLIPDSHFSNLRLKLRTYWDEFFRFLQNLVSLHSMQKSWIASKLGLEDLRSPLVTMRFSMPKTRKSCLVLLLTRSFVREYQCLCLSSLKKRMKRMRSVQCRIVNLRPSLTSLGESFGECFQRGLDKQLI